MGGVGKPLECWVIDGRFLTIGWRQLRVGRNSVRMTVRLRTESKQTWIPTTEHQTTSSPPPSPDHVRPLHGLATDNDWVGLALNPHASVRTNHADRNLARLPIGQRQ